MSEYETLINYPSNSKSFFSFITTYALKMLKAPFKNTIVLIPR